MREDLYFELPTDVTNPSQVLFSIPNQMTGGQFINIWITGLYGVLLIGATRYQQSLQAASLYASYGTFIITFLVVILGSYLPVPVAGGNQLIPATVILVANMLWNFMSGGRFR